MTENNFYHADSGQPDFRPSFSHFALSLAIIVLSMPLLKVPHCSGSVPHAEPDTIIDLAGVWRFKLDRENVGIKEKWYSHTLPDKIKLPGILQAQGYGDDISIRTPWVSTLHDPYWYLREEYKTYTNPAMVKVPFTSQPPKHYLGVAWYQRDISIPKSWAGKHVRLFLERARWQTTVWVDDQLIGTNNFLCTPHEFNLGELSPGKHTITIRVDNGMILPYRPDAHGVSDSLGGTWNGIVGRIELHAVPKVWIDHVQIETTFHTLDVYTTVLIASEEPKIANEAQLNLTVIDPNTKKIMGATSKNISIKGDQRFVPVVARIPITEKVTYWDEFHPVLYELVATVHSSAGTHSLRRKFGFREIKVEGRDILLNNRPIFLRGTHHGGDFPLTGYPPTDVAYWRKIFHICKKWGLNHVRFHSFCPPDAAFTAADELGIYLQIEPGMWNEFNPGSIMESHLYVETERILRTYGHHPSFIMFSASNEPKGRWRNVLPLWAEHFRILDPQRLYTPGTGFTEPDAPGPTELSDYIVVQRFGRNRVRGPGGWFGIDYTRSMTNVFQPVVVHELGQWCAYPSFDIIKKFTGYLRPSNYEIFRGSAQEAGLLPLAPKFQFASGKFQALCYKEDIEAVTRTVGLAGYQLLDLHDYLGQGTALVGVLDAFWDPRGYITPAEWREFCNPIVPLAWITNRIWTTTNTFFARLGVAHFGPIPVTNLVVKWSLSEFTANLPIASGEFFAWAIRLGKETNLCTIAIPLKNVHAPAKYIFKVQFFELVEPNHLSKAHPGKKRTLVSQNHWPIWVYPAEIDTNVPSNVFLTQDWNEAEKHLITGGRVIFVPPIHMLNWWCPPLDPVPIFWNRQMNPQWNRMLGLLCNKSHPALASFPTEEYYEWQWSELVSRCRAINIGQLKSLVTPIVVAIDDWNRNWRLAPIFEARVANGRLLVCSFDIINQLNNRPVARQLRKSLVTYAASRNFNPRSSVSVDELRSLWFNNFTMKLLRAQVIPPEAGLLMDGNPNTAWQARFLQTNLTNRQEVTYIEFRFPDKIPIDGLILLNCQNDRFRLGDIKDFVTELSEDGSTWQEVARGTLSSTFNPQTIRFPKTYHASHLRFKPLSMHVPGGIPTIAELSVISPLLLPSEPIEPQALRYRPTGYSSPDIDEAPPPWQ